MKKNKNDNFNVLREVGKKPGTSQRELSKNLGLSLGKINYCIKALRDKGLIKISNFSKNPNKLKYVYILTPKGVASKTRLTIDFMKRKMKEYEELKKELEWFSLYKIFFKEFMVSAIVISHNYGRFLKKCVKSILHNNKNYINEIIIIDDSSSDNTQKIALNLKKKK